MHINYQWIAKLLVLFIQIIKLDFYLELNQEERCLIESFTQNKEIMLKLKLIQEQNT